MGMISCPECGEQISTSASACPKCGKVLKKKKAGCGKVTLIVLGSLVVLGIIGSVAGSGSSSRRTTSSSSGSSSSGSSSTSSRDTEVTYEEYCDVRNGMSYREAVAVIGFEGEEMSSSSIAGIETIMYSWSNRFGTNMNATFQNDEMVLKAQFGLD